MNNNKEKTDENTAQNNQAVVSLNIPLTTTENKLKLILASLDFDAPLPSLDEVDLVTLQITIENGGQSDGE